MITYEMFEATLIRDLVRYCNNTDYDFGIMRENELIVPISIICVERRAEGIRIIRHEAEGAAASCKYSDNIAFMEKFLSKYQIPYKLVLYSDKKAIKETRWSGSFSNLHERWYLRVSNERLVEIFNQSKVENQETICAVANDFRDKSKFNARFVQAIQRWTLYSEKGDCKECYFLVSNEMIESFGFREDTYYDSAKLYYGAISLRDLYTFEEMVGVGLAAYEILSNKMNMWFFDKPYISAINYHGIDCAKIDFAIQKIQRPKEEW